MFISYSCDRNVQGRIQDLKKGGGAGGARSPKIFLTILGDFLKNLAQKDLCLMWHYFINYIELGQYNRLKK